MSSIVFRVFVFSSSGKSARMPKESGTPPKCLKTRAKQMATNTETQVSRSTSGVFENAPEPVPRWTFLTNHAHVLAVLNANPEIVLRHVAGQVGITERAVQRIVQDLEEDGFIKRERVGRRNRYRILKQKSLRHPIESHCNIGDLLGLISVR